MGTNREVVVTGGGTGIGYAFAEAGDRVTSTGRRENVFTEAAALLGARPVVFNAADPAAVEAALGELPGRGSRPPSNGTCGPMWSAPPW